MNILHIYDGHERVFPGEGSVPSAVYYIAKYTAEYGHDVTLIERRWKGTTYNEKLDGIKFFRFDLNICSNISNKDIVYYLIRTPTGFIRFICDRTAFALKVNKFLKRDIDRFDVIHVHLPFTACILVNMNKNIRDKMIYTAYADDYRLGLSKFLKPPLVARLFSPDIYLMKRVRRSVVLNESIRSKLVNLGIDNKKIVAIPLGVNLNEFNNVNEENIEEIMNKYKINNDKIIIMFSGTIVPRKGVIHLVKAIEQIDNNILLLIAGNTNVDKEYAKIVRDYAKKKGINAKFTGFIPYNDLRILFFLCDIFVLPSYEEGFGLVVTEALAAGKPVIGSRVGGIPMQIKDGWNGFLVEPGNEKQLAEKIRYLIENEEERKRMGKNSRKLAEEQFDWSKVAERYLDVYKVF